jgi:cyclopropane-fatty-acyl-phospholipid synthase
MTAASSADVSSSIARRLIAAAVIKTITRVRPARTKLRIVDPRALSSRIAREGLTGVGDSYVKQEWESADLVGALIPFAKLLKAVSNSLPGRFLSRFGPGRGGWDANDIETARRQAEWHYDLPADFFACFLDETLTYSCAIFESRDMSLFDAQNRKIERALSRLASDPGSSLLDIGCGWGSLARTAAERGMEVTGLSAAGRQVDYARRKTAAAGANVKFVTGDYRTIGGQYDSIVSIEMIEAVGSRNLEEYMQIVASALKQRGSFVLQFIYMSEVRLRLSKADTWIRRRIFPGGQILSKERVRRAAAAAGLAVASELELGQHYAITLDCWLRELQAHRDDIERMGFTTAFFRQWEYYLAMCCASFSIGDLACAQWVLKHDLEETHDD